MCGSIRITLEKASLEQDIIIHKPLNINHLDIGLSSQVRLVAITEWLDLPPVQVNSQVLRQELNPAQRVQMAEPDLIDDQLTFSDTVQIGAGRAFSLNNGVEVSLPRCTNPSRPPN